MGEPKSKYNAKKTVIDGITFDSAKESRYYQELKLRKRANDIIDFELQPEFVLQPPYRHLGRAVRAIKYRADFSIVHNDFSVEVVDCKGYKTDVYSLKKKMLQFKFPDMIFSEV